MYHSLGSQMLWGARTAFAETRIGRIQPIAQACGAKTVGPNGIFRPAMERRENQEWKPTPWMLSLKRSFPDIP